MSRAFPSSLKLDPQRSALLVVDMQVGFIELDQPTAVAHAREILPAINRLSTALRNAGGSVLFTRHTIDDATPDMCLPPWERAIMPNDIAERFARGIRTHDLHPELVIGSDDVVIDKYRYSAFAKASESLHEALRRRGVTTLIVVGTLTNVCCESSARDAHSLDYRVIFVADATATHTDAAQAATLDTLGTFFATVIDSDGVIALFGDEGEGRE